MISISQAISRLVINTPFLEHALQQNLINLSALARQIKPQIETITKKTVTQGAIIMALKRYSQQIQTNPNIQNLNQQINHLSVRSNLVEVTYANSTTLVQKIAQLYHQIENHPDTFLTITQGTHETTIISSNTLLPKIIQFFSQEAKLSTFENLSSISIKLNSQVVHTPGIHYQILKHLSWANINVIESVSTYTEFTVILENKYVDQAFSILNNLTDK